MKVLVSYRALQTWRVPIFERLSLLDDVELVVVHAKEAQGTKLKNHKGPVGFRTKVLNGFHINFRYKDRHIVIPVTFGLFPTLLSEKPDVILTEGASNFVSNITCFLYAKLFRIPIIQWGLGRIEGRKISVFRGLLDILFKRVEKYSDGAIAYSSSGKKYYESLVGMKSDDVFVAVNVVDTELRQKQFEEYCVQNRLSLPSPVPKAFNVLFVGALTYGKSIDKLLRSFSKFKNNLNTEAINIKLTIVGDGPLRNELEKLAEELNITKETEFTGHIDKGIQKYFYNASVFILPGLGGLAVSDALCHGVPVISSIGDGCEQDLISSSYNGFFIADLDEATLAQKITQLFNDDILLKRLRVGAQEFVSSEFQVSSYIRNIKMCIDRVQEKK